MSWTVRGRDRNGDPFEARWDGALELTGPMLFELRLAAELGEAFDASPTGPSYLLDLTDERAVAVALLEIGRDTVVEGDFPLLVPALPPGAVG